MTNEAGNISCWLSLLCGFQALQILADSPHLLRKRLLLLTWCEPLFRLRGCTHNIRRTYSNRYSTVLNLRDFSGGAAYAHGSHYVNELWSARLCWGSGNRSTLLTCSDSHIVQYIYFSRCADHMFSRASAFLSDFPHGHTCTSSLHRSTEVESFFSFLTKSWCFTPSSVSNLVCAGQFNNFSRLSILRASRMISMSCSRYFGWGRGTGSWCSAITLASKRVRAVARTSNRELIFLCDSRGV